MSLIKFLCQLRPAVMTPTEETRDLAEKAVAAAETLVTAEQAAAAVMAEMAVRPATAATADLAEMAESVALSPLATRPLGLKLKTLSTSTKPLSKLVVVMIRKMDIILSQEGTISLSEIAILPTSQTALKLKRKLATTTLMAEVAQMVVMPAKADPTREMAATSLPAMEVIIGGKVSTEMAVTAATVVRPATAATADLAVKAEWVETS